MTTSEICTRYIESDKPAGEIILLARQSGCKPSEIIYTLNSCGIETPIETPVDISERNLSIFTPDLDAKIMELKNIGLLPHKIAEQVGIDARKTSNRLKYLKRKNKARRADCTDTVKGNGSNIVRS